MGDNVLMDTSIALQARLPQFDNPLEKLAQVSQIQNYQNQNRLADLAFADKEREQSDTNALNSAYKSALGTDGKIDRLKLYSGAANSNLGYKLPALQKTFAEQDKAQSETDYKNLEIAHKRADMIGQGLGWLKDNPSMENAAAVIQDFVQSGIMPQDVAKQKMATFAQDPSPAGIQKLAMMGYQGALSAKDQLPTFQTRNTGGTTDTLSINPVTGKVNVANSVRNTQSPDNAASTAATMRGQNMTDARSRESNANAMSTPEYKQDADGNWIALPKKVAQGASIIAQPVMGADGNPLKAAPKPATEFQGKSAGYGARAEQADKLITELSGKYSPAAINSKQSVGGFPLVGGALEAGANMMLPANSQKAEQAQRDFINAVLRQESGAAISPSEFDNAKKQYFPQPGDGAAVLKQKEDNRKLAIQGFKNSAGKASFSAPPSSNTAKFLGFE